MRRLRCIIHGRVQRVLFRNFSRSTAINLRLTGTVQNMSDGTVEVVAEGEEKNLQKLLEYLKKGPLFSRVNKVESVWQEYSGEFKGFTIVYSSLWDRL